MAGSTTTAISRMRENDAEKFSRQKAQMRGHMMQAFSEHLNLTEWTPQDDLMLDSMTHWLANLSSRAGRDVQQTETARIATETVETVIREATATRTPALQTPASNSTSPTARQ